MGHRRRPWGARLFLPLLLFPLLPAAQSPAPDAQLDRDLQKELEEIEKRFTEERAGLIEFRLNAATAEEAAEINAGFPREEFVDPLLSIATRAKGTETAARAWLDLFSIACLLDDRELFTRAVDTLVAEHVESQYMPNLALGLTYNYSPPWSKPQAAAALRKIVAGAKDPIVRAFALAQLALTVGHDETLGDKGIAEAEQLLASIEKDYAGTDFVGMTGEQFAAGALHEITKLRVGQVAPDFEAVDQEGVKFKLSDYRGRVVLMDFWGFV